MNKKDKMSGSATYVIELYGGPGSGKSTTAADVYVNMKKQGLKVELVREVAKLDAWNRQRKVTPTVQLEYASKQLMEESALYGNADFIVTDSPVLLGGFYSELFGKNYLTPHLLELQSAQDAPNLNVIRIPIFIERDKEYFQHGRYQDEEQAREIDTKLQTFLKERSIHTTNVKTYDVDSIINIVNAVMQREAL